MGLKGKNAISDQKKYFFDSGQELTSEINWLEGTIVNGDFFGSHTRYQIKLADGSHLKLSIHHRKTTKNRYANGSFGNFS